MQGIMEQAGVTSWITGGIERVRELTPTPIKDRLTPAIVRAKLSALAAMVNYHPSHRHHLRDVHPTGTPFVFEARLQFLTGDGQGAHALFEGGVMRVGSGPLEGADLSVRFRGLEEMRAFFSGTDAFDMLLDNGLIIDGNLSYLLKFGHMSASVELGGAVQRPPRRSPPGPVNWQDLPVHRAGTPCASAPAGEVQYLEEPHLAAYSLDDFPAIKRLLWGQRRAQPAICSERPRLLTEQKLREAPRCPPALRQARAVRHVLTHKRPIIRDDDLLAGTTTSKRVGVMIYPELGGLGIWPELLTAPSRALNPYAIDEETVEILDRQVFPFWMDDNVREWTRRENDRPDALTLDERFVLYFMWKTQAASHTTIDLPRVLARGVDAIQAEAAQHEQETDDAERRSFYRALQVACEGITAYAANLAAEARRLAAAVEGDNAAAAARRADLLEMARICDKVPGAPAETLHEAVQAIWLLLLAQHQESMNAGMALGRLDLCLQPYLQRELEHAADEQERRARMERALELICALMLKLTDHLPLVPDVGNRLFGGSSGNQVITVGGVTPEDGSAVCDATWLILKATEMLRLRDPNINARYAPTINSPAYLRRLCELNLLTGATPSLHNDAAVVPALEAQGFTPEHARDWTATGCVEPTSCGRHFGHTNCMMLNMVAALEMALNDGVHPLLGAQIGPRTGRPATLASYADFLAAYKQQLGWLIDKAVEANNMLGRAHQRLKPTPLLSALFDGPMQRGRDVIDGGAVYNTSGAALVGLTDVVDSLLAVEQLVYREGRLDLASLRAALERDFEGHEPLLAELLHRAPKFGQRDGRALAAARELMDFVFERFGGQEHYRGGRYLPGYWSMSNHVAFGLLSGALPSGRRRGAAFTPGLTPSCRTRAALTEQLRAVAGLEGDKMPNNIAFNVKVTPGAHDTDAAVVDRMAAYVGAYFELGGMQLQFNVMDSATLRAAVEDPEAHRDLLVRISGYNAYFVELNHDIQQEVIERTEHGLAG
jgi:pyruvate formate-lyase/glycerol dehydratase family glycyl radical enzyme